MPERRHCSVGRREGPSMAQRGYPGIHAGIPTPQCLRSASVVNGAPKSTSSPRRPDSRPGSPSRTPIRSVGAKLARDGASQLNIHVTEPPSSRASSLPHPISANTKFILNTEPLWERACSRRGQHIQHFHRLEHRLREQARSHMDFRQPQDAQTPQNPVGAGLLAKASVPSNMIAN